MTEEPSDRPKLRSGKKKSTFRDAFSGNLVTSLGVSTIALVIGATFWGAAKSIKDLSENDVVVKAIRSISDTKYVSIFPLILAVILTSYVVLVTLSRVRQDAQRAAEMRLRETTLRRRVVKNTNSSQPGPVRITQAQAEIDDIEIALRRFSNLSTALENEVISLKGTAIVNLILGTIMFTVCLSILAIIQFMSCDPKTNSSILSTLNGPFFIASKAIFSLSFAAFAFFFLTAYRNSVNQIRYYRNEITNITSVSVAVILSKGATPTVRQRVIDSLLKGERNFVLKKGETTADIQLHESHAKEMTNLIAAFSQGFQSGKTSGNTKR